LLKSLHPNQHAYQAVKSVETALHQIVVRVEKALDQQEIALGVFLDIEGAFNNTSYDSMCAALAGHGVYYTIVRWIRATLEGQRAMVTPGGLSRSVAVERTWTWREHVDVKVRKAQNLLWACRRACGMTWGLGPRMVHWFYVSVIRPSITFVSLVW